MLEFVKILAFTIWPNDTSVLAQIINVGFLLFFQITWSNQGERFWSIVKQGSHALLQSAWPTSWGRSSCDWMRPSTSSSSAGMSSHQTSVSWVSCYSSSQRSSPQPRLMPSHLNQRHPVPPSPPPFLPTTLPPPSTPKTSSHLCSPSLPLACRPQSTTSSNWAQ